MTSLSSALHKPRQKSCIVAVLHDKNYIDTSKHCYHNSCLPQIPVYTSEIKLYVVKNSVDWWIALLFGWPSKYISWDCSPPQFLKACFDIFNNWIHTWGTYWTCGHYNSFVNMATRLVPKFCLLKLKPIIPMTFAYYSYHLPVIPTLMTIQKVTYSCNNWSFYIITWCLLGQNCSAAAKEKHIPTIIISGGSRNYLGHAHFRLRGHALASFSCMHAAWPWLCSAAEIALYDGKVPFGFQLSAKEKVLPVCIQVSEFCQRVRLVSNVRKSVVRNLYVSVTLSQTLAVTVATRQCCTVIICIYGR